MRGDTQLADTTSTSSRQSEARRPTSDDRQAAAQSAYRESFARGKPLTGAELGDLFGRSERWGRDRIAEVRAETNGNDRSENGAPQSGHGGNGPRAYNAPDGNPPDTNQSRRSPTRAAGPQSGTSANGGSGNGHGDGRSEATNGAPHLVNGRRPLQPGGGTNGDSDTEPTGSHNRQPLDNGSATVLRYTHRPLPSGNGKAVGEPPHVAGSLRPMPTGTPAPPDGSQPAPRADLSLMTAGGSPSPWVRRITILAVVIVAVVAAVVSYVHQLAVARLAGEGWRAWLIPFSVDGMMVAASMTLLTARRSGRTSGTLAWLALILGLAASLGSNVIAADPGLMDEAWLSRAVAAWPPLALAISFELCLGQLRAEKNVPDVARRGRS